MCCKGSSDSLSFVLSMQNLVLTSKGVRGSLLVSQTRVTMAQEHGFSSPLITCCNVETVLSSYSDRTMENPKWKNENTLAKVPDAQLTERRRKLCCSPQMLSDDTLGFGSCGSQWSVVKFQRFFLVTTKVLTLKSEAGSEWALR